MDLSCDFKSDIFSFSKIREYFDDLYGYARTQTTCRKVAVGAMFLLRDEIRIVECNRNDDESKQCTNLGECYKYKVTGIYESNEKTRPFCSAVHSEIRLINQLKKFSNFKPEDGILFVTRYPCVNCAKEIAKFGIKTVYYCGRQRISKEVESIFESNGINWKWYPQFDYEF